jgi:hypothetical protein
MPITTEPKRYRVLVGLNYPTSPSVIKRILAGEDVPFEQRHEKHAEAGTIVTDIPESSVAKLLANGRIEEVTGDS